MRSTFAPAVAAALISTATLARGASPLSVDNDDDIKSTASQIAFDMMAYYKGNLTGQTPGILPGPPPVDNPWGGYYWWEAGAMWGTLMDYWLWTNDTTYNDEVMAGMMFQTGDNNDYLPDNVTLSLGNDDQGFWGLSAMTGAENNFPNPPSDKPGWLALAQGVWATQASPQRHDNLCGGGLHWQIPPSNPGYNYKNSIANGCFFNLGARLARYTGESKYHDSAESTWNWFEGVKYVNMQTGAVYDGAYTDDNCTKISRVEYSDVNGVWALGAAHMYNLTKDDKWRQRTELLVNYGLKTFFPNGIATEPSCEDNGPGPVGSCSQDMMTFKGFMHRWYSTIALLMPDNEIAAKITPIMQSSAKAAISVCTGGDNGRQCSYKWKSHKYDGKTGAGQEMSVLAATSALLAGKAAKPPVTSKTGGTSKGDPNAGKDSDDFQKHYKPITTGDKAGASIITILILGGVCGIFGWMSIGA